MKKVLTCAPLLGIVLLGGCDRQFRWSPVDMWNRSRYKPLEPEPFFADGSSSRPLPPGTVARGQLHTDELLYEGRKRGSGVASNYVIGNDMRGAASNTPTSAGGVNVTVATMGDHGRKIVDRAIGGNALGTDATLATTFPFPVTEQVLNRGHERFNIYCAPCHGQAGDGEGMIVQRGFSPPPSFHIPRLQNAPVGHYFDVITHGYGAMYSYASRVEPRDRWAIIAYIRLLQKSRIASGSTVGGVDTPRTYPSPGASQYRGTNYPGLPHTPSGGAPVPGTSGFVSPNNARGTTEAPKTSQATGKKKLVAQTAEKSRRLALNSGQSIGKEVAAQ